MGEQGIYNALRAGGLTHAAACAMMGNMYCESLLRGNNVEDRCPVSDSDYTWNVDNGKIPLKSFKSDAYGYGLCQWTYSTRKEALYNFAKSRGVSIGDEEMQCAFCLEELKGYTSLLPFLQTTDDMYQATSRICIDYERPAVNNIDARYAAAQRYNWITWDGTAQAASTSSSAQANTGSTESCEISVRVLRKGDKGRDVFMLQNGLNDFGANCGKSDGDFGSKTESGLNTFKAMVNLQADGVADADVWQILFS